MLRSLDWYLVTEVSGKLIGPNFKGHCWKWRRKVVPKCR